MTHAHYESPNITFGDNYKIVTVGLCSNLPQKGTCIAFEGLSIFFSRNFLAKKSTIRSALCKSHKALKISIKSSSYSFLVTPLQEINKFLSKKNTFAVNW